MSKKNNNERIIMVKVETEDGDGYVFITGDAQRAIEQFEEWSGRFGADRVQGNEGFDRLARPLMALGERGEPPSSRH